MSSTMLEQAIIDAKSLKDAAVKTAEEELLKKYSSQIKEAVQNLLEQDEDPLTIGEDTSIETEDVVEKLEMKALDGENNSDLEEGEMVELDLDALKEELEEAGDMTEIRNAIMEECSLMREEVELMEDRLEKMRIERDTAVLKLSKYVTEEQDDDIDSENN